MLRDVLSLGKELADKVTNVVMNYTEVEVKVRNATNDDPWGPTGPEMQEIAELTKHYECYPQIMGMIWKRMFYEQRNNWRRVYKSLLLLTHLIKNGSDKVIGGCRDHMYDLQLLKSYQYVEESGKDQGINVRHKVKDILDLLQNEERLRTERKKAVSNRPKYTNGISSYGMERDYNRSYYDDSYNSHHERDASPRSQTPPMTMSHSQTMPQMTMADDNITHVPKLPAAPSLQNHHHPQLTKSQSQEPVADLLDLTFDTGSINQNARSTANPDVFDPFNQLSSSGVVSTANHHVPSLPNSPQHVINNGLRLSDDFGQFICAPIENPSNWPSHPSGLIDISQTVQRPIPATIGTTAKPISAQPDDLFGDFNIPAQHPVANTNSTQISCDWSQLSTNTASSTNTWSDVSNINIDPFVSIPRKLNTPGNNTNKAGLSLNQLQQHQKLQFDQQPIRSAVTITTHQSNSFGTTNNIKDFNDWLN